MQIYNDKNKWQEKVGYSRAVKLDNYIHVSGTVANDEEGNPVGIDNAAEQTRIILLKIKKVLQYFKADMKDVYRTRIYTTDISLWEEIGEIHGEFFKGVDPATTMVEVSKLISENYIVEIEADAKITKK